MVAVLKRLWCVCAILVVMLVTACGPLPQPFKSPPGAPANPLVTEAAARGVWVQPLDGVSRPMSKLLADAVVEGFQARGFRATTNPNANSRYRLKGKAALNKDDPSLPYVVLITWTLFDYSGNPIGAEVEGVPGSRRDWDFGSPEVIAEVGKKAPEIISAMIGEDEKVKEQEQQPVKPQLAGVWANPVTNAPGDGNGSLTRAIKAAILGGGIALARDRRYAEFVLDGNVHVGGPENDRQRVEIVWTVSTADSREIGRATQKNLVEAGILSGAWGPVAPIIAEAALEGIVGVLRAAGAYRFRLSPPERVLKTDIPSGSGKPALPPPSLDLEGLRPVPKKP